MLNVIARCKTAGWVAVLLLSPCRAPAQTVPNVSSYLTPNLGSPMFGAIVVNPNNGSTCVLGNVGCPAFPGGPGDYVTLKPTGDRAYSLNYGSSAAFENCNLVRTSPGNFYNFQVVTNGSITSPATGDWVYAFDLDAIPSNGTISWTVLNSGVVGPNGKYSFSVGISPIATSNGLLLCLSSSPPPTFTAETTNSAWFTWAIE